jgi:hypothetical protein
MQKTIVDKVSNLEGDATTPTIATEELASLAGQVNLSSTHSVHAPTTGFIETLEGNLFAFQFIDSTTESYI